MKEKNNAPKKRRHLSMFIAVVIGLVLIAASVPISVATETENVRALAESASDALKQQCTSFGKVVTADRAKSLFRMTDMIRDLRNRIANEPGLLSDAFLEEYVDSLRITGVVILNDDLEIAASGYTRQYRDSDWTNTELGKRFSDIITHPAKIFAERVEVNGEYYDLCAMARKDAAGIIIGFYKQPSGLISDTESDLESMLSGLYLEDGGHYVIYSGDTVSATSDTYFQGRNIADSEMLYQLANIRKDGQIHLIHADGYSWWGYRSACEGYIIAIYYPMASVLRDCLVAVIVVAAVYLFLCVLLYSFRNRVLYENQEKLRESNRQLTEKVNMLKSLETIYFCLIYVDVRKTATRPYMRRRGLSISSRAGVSTRS